MKFGISIPGHGPAASPDNLTLIAQCAEGLGFDSVLLGDHIVIPNSIASNYPYSATGSFSSAESGEWLDQLTVLAFLAAKTQRIRLVPSVMVLPHRNPVVAAKILSTLDVLSDGRLSVGVGAGWLKEEFLALGLPFFKERGTVSNEYIQVFKELWTNDNPSFHGKYCSFSNIRFLPKPLQKPHPPIWVGGESPAALRRAAALGNAWHPIGSNPRHPLTTVDQLKSSIDQLHRYASEAGRDPSQIQIAYRVPTYPFSYQQRPEAFTGDADQTVRDIDAFASVGVSHLTFDFRSPDSRGTIRLMEEFAHQIMAKTSND